MNSELSREEFDILDNLYQNNNQDIIKNDAYDKLVSSGYITDGKINKKGLEALEPYRVKRAVFIAAGFGKRLVPITINTPKPLVRVFDVRIIDRLIDACLAADIEDIVIVRGYLKEQFDQLLIKYPMIRFIDNDIYNVANNISSSYFARNLLSGSYVFEADLLISNPKIIKKYQYSSNFLAIRKDHTDDWCFETEKGIITKEKVGGDNCFQMVGISYWDENDGLKLSQDIEKVFNSDEGKQLYWEQVPLVYCKDNYKVEVRECFDEDIVEIDTFDELKAIDKVYDV